MQFATLMYHELRHSADFDHSRPSAIDVRQGYEAILPAPLFCTVENFREQIAYLSENGYHTLTLGEVKSFYAGELELPERSVLLTFDDCFQSVKKYAYPILKEYGFRAVAFVVTGWLHDSPKPFDPLKSVCMARNELGDIADVFEFANHTHEFHLRFGPDSSSLTKASDDQLRLDLEACNRFDGIGAHDVFAYPFGVYEARNVELLRREGFKLAFTTEPGRNGNNDDPLQLNRYTVPYYMDLKSFASLLE